MEFNYTETSSFLKYNSHFLQLRTLYILAGVSYKGWGCVSFTHDDYC